MEDRTKEGKRLKRLAHKCANACAEAARNPSAFSFKQYLEAEAKLFAAIDALTKESQPKEE